MKQLNINKKRLVQLISECLKPTEVSEYRHRAKPCVKCGIYGPVEKSSWRTDRFTGDVLDGKNRRPLAIEDEPGTGLIWAFLYFQSIGRRRF
jgi:hypothetical protein